MIAGLESITSGEIRIDGKRINELPPRDRDIAMDFQSYAFYPHMSVAGNMAFSMENQDRPEEEKQRMIDQAAEILRLLRLLHCLPGD